ncbi:Fe-S cluster assembly protein SufD [Gracilibacillus halotolerans]|uniref:Fe-S cluster assembly protein SufD n=1 Tax=Gracilibacillus halotolerans TaxID=74386 RepID=A0A841RQS7_9BACI|nr:Fe-S cluster assembly protein SufD [Gracilibacillus halotolerans]MBB6514182.1 Fe-S cluster assembly protein SufD [Gracilibacillus halotolerans]
MSVETKLPYDQDYVSSFSDKRNEPNWMKEIRLKGLELADRLEMPRPDKTNITRWNFEDFKHSVDGDKITSANELPDAIQAFLDTDKENKNIVVQRNNSVAYASLSSELKDKGVILTDIATALKEHSDLVEKYYMKDAVQIDEHRLTALHAALMNGGVFVYVPKNVQVEEPLQAVFWQEDKEAATFNHVIVVADENSSLTYVENYISHNDNEKAVANIVAEVIAHDNASITFGSVDNFAAGTTVYVNRRGVAYRDAKIEWNLGQMNDGNTASENVTHLIGDNSFSYAKTVSVGRGSQIQNFTARIVNHGKNSNGLILQHGVMKEKSTGIFNGIGKIEHGATKANAEQESRVLMLSEGSRGDANPILLIDEDDVTAGHAASVGRVDPLQLYYLMSRGISQEEAERLIIFGFLAPVVNEIPIEAVKNQLTEVIERKVY